MDAARRMIPGAFGLSVKCPYPQCAPVIVKSPSLTDRASAARAEVASQLRWVSPAAQCVVLLLRLSGPAVDPIPPGQPPGMHHERPKRQPSQKDKRPPPPKPRRDDE